MYNVLNCGRRDFENLDTVFIFYLKENVEYYWWETKEIHQKDIVLIFKSRSSGDQKNHKVFGLHYKKKRKYIIANT